MSKTYRLKTMILARLLAEATGLLVLFSLPWILFFAGEFNSLPVIYKILLTVLSVGALLIVPTYGMITWQVKADDKGITTYALFKKKFVAWAEITGIKLKTNWNFRRYEIACGESHITFPAWLDNLKELIETIRAHLPGGGRPAPEGDHVYQMHIGTLLFELAKLVFSLGFVIVFWFFCHSLCLSENAKVSQPDKIMILVVSLIFTLVMLWRVYIILLMPIKITTNKNGMILKNLFFEQQLSWSDNARFKTADIFLPEGLMLKLKKNKFLISSNLESFDDLAEELGRKLTFDQPKTKK